MPSSYTTRNRAEKQAPGENNNSWGSLLNTGTIDVIDQALDGMISFTGNITLSTANGSTDEARRRYINITGGTTATVTIPNVEKVYVVRNAGSGTATFTTGSGTTATVAAGTQAVVVCEGGNVCRAFAFGDAAADVLTKLLTVDGAGSGLDADLLDGQSSAAFQAANANLTTFAGLTATTDNFLVAVASAWASRTPAQVRATLGLLIGTNVQAYSANLDEYAAVNPTAAGLAILDDANAAAQLVTMGAQAALTFTSNANGSAIGIPIGGSTYYIQWGSISVSADSNGTVTYPVAFGTASVCVASGGPAATGDEGQAHTIASGTTTATIANTLGSSVTAFWIAAGV